MIEKKLDKKNCKVTFILDKGDFSEFDDIRVLGDFNGWHYERGLIMDLKKNQFKASVSLKGGQNYEFRYILNGRHWFNDPQADGLVNSPFYGISNTLLVLESGEEAPKKEKAEKKEVKKTIPAVTETAVKAKAPKAETKAKIEKPAVAKKETKAEAPVKAASVKKEAVKKETPAKAVKAAPKSEVVAKPTPAKKVAAPKAVKTETKAKTTAPKKAAAPAPVNDDLKLIEGIGPKIAELLIKDGISTFAQLSKTKVEKIAEILKNAGARYALANPGTWPDQAKLAAAGKMDELKKLQDELKGGK